MTQVGAAYEALPLVLILDNRREALVFAMLGFAAVPFLVAPDGTGEMYRAASAHNAGVLIIALYIPALVLVLARRHRPYLVCGTENSDRMKHPTLRTTIATIACLLTGTYLLFVLGAEAWAGWFRR